MSIAKITLIGMYQYMNDQNDPLFKNLAVPANMDKDKLIDAILYRGAEFGVLYADPYFMQSMIKIWSDRYYRTLDRWVTALSLEYNPIENYDRMEEWSDAGSRSKKGAASRTGSQIGIDGRENSGNAQDVRASESSQNTVNTNNTTQTTAGSKTSDQTNENRVSAFDSSNYENKDKQTTAGSNADVTASQTGSTGGSDVSGKANDVETHSTSDKQSGEDRRITAEQSNDNEEEGHVTSHTGRLHGNIGVTTSQQMLQAELDISRFNLYDEAAYLFLNEFCIYVY